MRTPLLDEAHRHQAPARGASRTVESLGRGGFLADVEHVGRGRLHAVRGLHGLDRALDLRVLLLEPLQVQAVEALHEIHLSALIVGLDVLVADVRDEGVGIEVVFESRDLVGNEGPLMDHG